MKKILIDGLVIRVHSGGIKVYLQKLLGHIEKQDQTKFILVTSKDNKQLFDQFDIDKINIPFSAANPIVRIFLQQFVIPVFVFLKTIDVLFQPVDIISLLAPCKKITCIHSNHINASLGQYGIIKKTYVMALFKWTIKRADRIITISDYVKDETVRIFGLGESKMKTIYHGGGLVEDRKEWSGEVNEDHFLFIGSLFTHKNVDKLIRAYAIALKENASLPKLCIVGKDSQGNLALYRQLVESLGCSNAVVFHGRVEDDQLLELIFNAMAIVYPSSIEGFGLPLVEAMQAKKPIICSNETSIPEVAGEAALITDVYDETVFAKDLIKVFVDRDLRSSLIEKSAKRGNFFHWEITAIETIKELQQLSYRGNSSPVMDDAL